MLAILTGVLASAEAGGGDPPLAVRVHPLHPVAPAAVRVTATVEPARDNRTLVITADSDEFRRSTTLSLEGEHAPRIHEVIWRGLPPGRYTIDAEVTDRAGDTLMRRRDHFDIIAR